MSRSISELMLYMRCPRAYKLHHIDGIEYLRKSIALCKSRAARNVIFAMHEMDKSLQDLSEEDISMICAKKWHQEISDPKVDKEELETIVVQEKTKTKTRPATPEITKAKRSLDEITEWCVNYAKLEHPEVLHQDVYFEVAIGDANFFGNIDQIRKAENGIQIIRFCTSSQSPSTACLSRDFQMSLYTYALWKGSIFRNHPDSQEVLEFKEIPSAYYFYLPHLETYKRKNGNAKKGELKGDPVIPVYRSKEVLFDFEYEILQLVAGIEMCFFPMRVVSPAGCNICAFSQYCQSATAHQEVMEYFAELKA